jgi:hypothetical protein
MPGMIEASTGSAWSYGGSILTFLFPMILFVVVATSLYVIYTKPSVVPGSPEQGVARPIGFTPVVRMPGSERQAGQAGGGSQVAEGETGQAAAPENPAARPGNPEAAE